MTPALAHALRLLECASHLNRPPTMAERQQMQEALQAVGYLTEDISGPESKTEAEASALCGGFSHRHS